MPKKVRATDPAPRTRDARPAPVTVTRIPGYRLAMETAAFLAGPDQHVALQRDGSVMVLNGSRPR